VPVTDYYQVPPTLEMGTSPHVRSDVTTEQIMRNVVYALVPVCAYAVWAFGLSALLLITAATAGCLLTEHIVCRMAKHDSTLGDYSALITGLLLGLTLPPGLPLWMGFLGGVVAIALGKALFGGLGSNVFNPALVGRAFLQAAFPVAVTTWTPAFAPGRFLACIPSSLALPFMQAPSVKGYIEAYNSAVADAYSGATPLSLWKFQDITTPTRDLLFGMTAGSAGETAAWVILLMGLYLAARKMMDWRITVGMLGSVFVFSSLFYVCDTNAYPTPFFMLFSGGLMLGAVFMATDMVTSPVTTWGVWIYSILIGFLTVLIRLLGGMPEGVMYAILLGNAVTPILNNLTQPRIYGKTKAETR